MFALSADRIYVFAGAALTAAALLYFWGCSRRKTPEQIEQLRRKRINDFGRITDGTVLDAQETEVHGAEAQLLIYRYEVSGVSYEASQDVTLLRQWIDLHSCRIGLPASVKYDPHNPGNSIVISEGWSGLRKSPARTSSERREEHVTGAGR